MNGEGDRGVIDAEGEVLGRCGGGFWANECDFRFVTVQLKEVSLQPRFQFCQTVGEGGVGDRGDGFCRNVDLYVVSVAVEA